MIATMPVTANLRIAREKALFVFFTCMSVDLFAERRIPLKHALCGIVSVFLGHRALPGGKATNP